LIIRYSKIDRAWTRYVNLHGTSLAFESRCTISIFVTLLIPCPSPSLYIYVCPSPDIIAVASSKTTTPSTILCPPNPLNGFSIVIAESARETIHRRFRSYIEPRCRLVCSSDFIEPICSCGFLPRCPNIFDGKEEEASWWQEAAQSPAIFRSATRAHGRWGYDFRRQAEPRRCCC
jgi:hypothetical protein